jgi:hypothetical protein
MIRGAKTDETFITALGIVLIWTALTLDLNWKVAMSNATYVAGCWASGIRYCWRSILYTLQIPLLHSIVISSSRLLNICSFFSFNFWMFCIELPSAEGDLLIREQTRAISATEETPPYLRMSTLTKTNND